MDISSDSDAEPAGRHPAAGARPRRRGRAADVRRQRLGHQLAAVEARGHGSAGDAHPNGRREPRRSRQAHRRLARFRTPIARIHIFESVFPL